MTLKLGDNVLAQSAYVGFSFDPERYTGANVNPSKPHFIAQQLARPLKKWKQPALVLHAAVELAQEPFFFGNPVVADRQWYNDCRTSGLLYGAKYPAFWREEAATAATCSFGVELERMSRV